MLSANAAASGSDGDNIITVNILSALPEGEPQGSFAIRVSPRATGRDLLRLVCKEARVPLDPNYVLSTSEGGQVPMDKPLLSVSCIQEGRNLHWNTYGILCVCVCVCVYVCVYLCVSMCICV